jgi:hypothetical protein
MARRAKLRDQLFLQAEPAVIRGNADAHIVISCIDLLPAVLPPRDRRLPDWNGLRRVL